MNQNEWNEGMNNIDPELVEKFILKKGKMKEKSKRAVWLRAAAVAACLALIVGAILMVPLFSKDDPLPLPVPPSDTYADGTTEKGTEPMLEGETNPDGEPSIEEPPFVWDTEGFATTDAEPCTEPLEKITTVSEETTTTEEDTTAEEDTLIEEITIIEE